VWADNSSEESLQQEFFYAVRAIEPRKKHASPAAAVGLPKIRPVAITILRYRPSAWVGWRSVRRSMNFPGILCQNRADCVPEEGLAAPHFFVDLDLDQIVAAVTASKAQYDLKPFFYMPLHDADAIIWRHEIMKDLENTRLFDNINAFAQDMRAMREYLAKAEKLHNKLQQERWFLDAVDIYCDAVNRLVCDLSIAAPTSRGLSAFREYLTRYAGSDRFTSLRKRTKKLAVDLSAIRYTVLIDGLRVEVRHYGGEPDYSAEVKATFERFQQGAVKEYTFQLMELPEMNHVEARILALVAQLYPATFSTLETYYLAFYAGCVNLYEELARKGEPTCFPLPMASDERRLSFRGLRETCLALRLGQGVVGNDVNADRKDLVIVTGANQGSKSTFLRSVGLAQLMMQCGMFVSADSFCSGICHGLFTHYKREEDAAMQSGKLDEELRRMSDIIDQLTSRSMILFNESFAATNEREGSEISRQIISALLDRGVRIVCVTHLYELAQGFFRKNKGNILFLRAERQTDGARTFKMVEGEPLQTSFGEDLYDRIFGVEVGVG
jgi:DNA mismatch repair protein MutS